VGDGASDTSANGLSERNSEESSSVRAPNEKKILAQMDKIVASLQVEQRAVSVVDKAKYKQAAGAPNWTPGLQE
jgi:hypothetical protein